MTTERQIWRQERRAARKAWVSALSPAERQQQEEGLAHVILPHLGQHGVLGAYAAIGSEISVGPAMRAAFRARWRITLPRARQGEPLTFHAVDAASPALAPGSYRIPEPAADLPDLRPDVLLVPLIAVDRSGHRMGQGGGHYDRTLAKLRATGRVLAIGVAWEMQIVPAIKAESWDQKVDAIATPNGFYLTGAGAIGP